MQYLNPARVVVGALLIVAALVNLNSHGATIAHVWKAVLACIPLLMTTAGVIWFILRRLARGRQPLGRWGRWPLLVGMLIPTSIGVFANEQWTVFATHVLSADRAARWWPFIAAPFSEEIAKAACVALVLLCLPGLPRTPISGLQVGALVGLGFQLVEDLVFASTAALDHGSSDMTGALTTEAIRCAIGLFSHWLFSAVAGVGVAIAVEAAGRRRAASAQAMVLVMAAIGLHAIANLPAPSNAILSLFLMVAGPVLDVLVLRRVLRRHCPVDDAGRDTLVPATAQAPAVPA